MALAITVNGAGTFTASMEEGPVSFSASLGAIGPAGPGVAAGGTTGQILVKTTNADYATGWIDNAARTVFVTARNNTGSTIAKGAVVYLSGATGNKATIALAQADSEATSARTIGITKAEIANNADGDVIISGAIENLDTSAFTAGQTVYLSASVAGGLQTTLPTQPNHGVVLGIITRAHPSLGSIEVTVQNYQELKELSDVLITSPTNGQALIYETSSGLWKNASANPFDQSLNTTSPVRFNNYNAAGGVDITQDFDGQNVVVVNDAFSAGALTKVRSGLIRVESGGAELVLSAGTITFDDSTVQTTAYPGPPDLSAYLTKADNLASVASASTARTNLGLGTMATETASDYAKVGTTNTFSASQVISVTDNSKAALRITQLGTGDAFVVEDSTNPDTTPFRINANGDVGIGGLTSGVKLRVDGIFNVNGTSNLSAAGGSTPLNITNSGTQPSILVAHNNAASTADAVRITNLGSGNSFVVEDSTNPDSSPFIVDQFGSVILGKTTASAGVKLDVVGNATIANNNSVVIAVGANQVPVTINNAGTGASFRVNDETSDTTPFIVDAGGNVGVKTASPSTDFEVNGNAKATTAEITTAPAAGDSSSKVPTTAWVQAEVPAASTTAAGKVELATDAEAIAGTSGTLAVTPSRFLAATFNPSLFQFSTAFTAATSGAGSSTGQAGGESKFVAAPTSVAGYALLRSQCNTHRLGEPYNQSTNYTKRHSLSFRFALRSASTDAASILRIVYGKAATDNAGDLTRKGFGVKCVGGGLLVLTVHDGTTLTDTNSTVTIGDANTRNVLLTSENGTVKLFVDGVEVASTTSGPTGSGNAGQTNLQAEAENTGTLTGTRLSFDFVNPRMHFSD